MKRRLPALVLAGLLLGADLLSKSLVFRWFDQQGIGEGQVVWVLGDWFGLARVLNPGVTGGMGSFLGPTLLSVLTAAAAVGIALYLLLPDRHDHLTLAALALVLAGAAGNLHDRILYGAVRDFLDVWPRLKWPPWLHHWPTFNLADASIVTGVLLLVLHSLFLSKKGKKAGVR